MKAQTSVEFLLLVAFGTLLFVVFFAVIQDRIVVANSEQTSQDLQRLNGLITSEINLANRFGGGYQREFWLPITLDGLRYNATIKDNRTLILNSSTLTNLYFFDFPVYGQLKLGKNEILSLYGSSYLNIPLEDALTIKIDGNESDWDSLKDWYGISEIPDLENDEYVVSGQTNFLWDLKNLLMWNDDTYMYFKLELYNDIIFNYEAETSNTNKVDFLILLDTVPGGFKDDDPNKIITDLGVDYIISDKFARIGQTTFSKTDNKISYLDPYIFDSSASSTEFAFLSQAVGYPVRYEFVGQNAIELSVPLSRLGLDASSEDTIRYSVVARQNETKAADYLPGSFDDFSGGFYTLQNR